MRDARQLQDVCQQYFEALGFRTVIARQRADGGADLHLFVKGNPTPGIVVQCKGNVVPVSDKDIAQLLGRMKEASVDEGVCVTAGTFTATARTFAAGKNIHLIDGEDLERKLRDITL